MRDVKRLPEGEPLERREVFTSMGLVPMEVSAFNEGAVDVCYAPVVVVADDASGATGQEGYQSLPELDAAGITLDVEAKDTIQNLRESGPRAAKDHVFAGMAEDSRAIGFDCGCRCV